ncbi:M28 family peptidase [candidate division KSB1 bacterium]
MKRVTGILLLFILLSTFSTLSAQQTPWYQWTLLSQEQMDEIIGEASGETAYNTIMETGGYNKDRLADEYNSTFYEVEYIYKKLKEYGLPGAEIVRFPGGEVWDGVKGELWEVSPIRQKLASYMDMTAMLASGSKSADVVAELVWIGSGTAEEIEKADVSGKIVVTDGSMGSVHRTACIENGAHGVIAIGNSRPHFDPLQIPWSGVGGRGSSSADTKFGFYMPPREGAYLKSRLLNDEKITVHAQVESTTQSYDLQDITCYIPGTDPAAGEVIFSAHLFEGYTKQGANDNKSGSASILECARLLHRLIEEGRLPQPKRTIRFLWGPEYSGTGPWVSANKDIMARTLCNINMDMVGEWLSKNNAFFCLMRTTYGNPHYINDVMENYYRFVGEGNRERIQNRRNFFKVPHRIVAPTGSDEPFYYSIETHYGASDHEVFNDWGVQVPGIMMIAWPDQWYHTSGDRIDKSDPTQLKRVAVIGAAGAYTIANADDDMAIQIAGESTSNGTNRLGHQFVMALEELNNADVEIFEEAYKSACAMIETAVINEKATLMSILELAYDEDKVSKYIDEMVKTIDKIGSAHLSALETHMEAIAKKLYTSPVSVKMTALEKQASKIIPQETPLVKANGYRGYQDIIRGSSEDRQESRGQRPRGPRINTSELHLLINGKNSALDIKKMLDAQSSEKTDLQAVLDYLDTLEKAGLIKK